jgi:hypothetical protein
MNVSELIMTSSMILTIGNGFSPKSMKSQGSITILGNQEQFRNLGNFYSAPSTHTMMAFMLK